MLCIVLKIMEKCCCLHLSQPFQFTGCLCCKREKRIPHSDVILITVPGNDILFMTNDLADKLWLMSEHYAKVNRSRVKTCLSDERTRDALAKNITDPAEEFFWKVMWCYPAPMVYGPNGDRHFHGMVVCRRFENDDHQMSEFIKSIQELNLKTTVYHTIPQEIIDKEQGDPNEYTNMFFGKSTWWNIPTAQRLFIIEINVLLIKANEMKNRICYWTMTGKKYAPEGVELKDKLAWFSYEAHGNFEEMTFEKWRHKISYGQLFFLALSGYTCILYGGLEKNRSLAECKVTFGQMWKKFGFFFGFLLSIYAWMCANKQAAVNGAMMYKSKTYDYRDLEQVLKAEQSLARRAPGFSTSGRYHDSLGHAADKANDDDN